MLCEMGWDVAGGDCHEDTGAKEEMIPHQKCCGSNLHAASFYATRFRGLWLPILHRDIANLSIL